MKCSICIPTFNHAALLRRTLDSIRQQKVPFEFETIIVNDGSTDETQDVLRDNPWVRLIERPTKTYFAPPGPVINVAFKAAVGEVIITQSDDVAHSPGTIESICNAIAPERFIVGAVRDVHGEDGKRPEEWGAVENTLRPNWVGWHAHGLYSRRPLLYLGAVYREDVYRIGGYDERFTAPAYSDNWFSDCLMYGRGLQPEYRDDILGYHQTHDYSRQPDWNPSRLLYNRLCEAGRFHTPTAPWPPYSCVREFVPPPQPPQLSRLEWYRSKRQSILNR